MANRHPLRITEADLELCFKYWYDHDRNYKATAVEFKRTRTTIYRYAKKRDWEKRAEGIRLKVTKGIDHKIGQEQVVNIQKASECLIKELKAYLDKDRETKGSIKEIIALMKYIDEAGKPNEIAEALRAVAEQDNLPYDPELAAECLDLLTEAVAEQKRLDDQKG